MKESKTHSGDGGQTEEVYIKDGIKEDTSPAAVGWFRASSSMMVALRYFVSYLYFKEVSSENQTITNISSRSLCFVQHYEQLYAEHH